MDKISKTIKLTSPRSDLEGKAELFALAATDWMGTEVSNANYRAMLSLDERGTIQFAIGKKNESIPCVFSWDMEKLAELAATQRLTLKVRR